MRSAFASLVVASALLPALACNNRLYEFNGTIAPTPAELGKTLAPLVG